jgi:hypothetical protein
MAVTRVGAGGLPLSVRPISNQTILDVATALSPSVPEGIAVVPSLMRPQVVLLHGFPHASISRSGTGPLASPWISST